MTKGALAVCVLSCWLASLGLIRLRTPLGRLHCAAFLSVAGGGTLLLAAMLADGMSVRVGKLALLVLVDLVGGAASAHAIGRALLLRGSVAER